jgi:PhnB protein
LRLSAHLCFDGSCKEAFIFYRQVLGGELATLMTYGESPLASQIPAQFHDRIVHATLLLGTFDLLGADVLPDQYRRPQGFYVTLSLPDPIRGRTIFTALSEGGRVVMPFAEAFWSPGFGVLVDRFDVPWEINVGD